MKEYKIIRQKSNLFKNNDTEFEKELNDYAAKGWNVLNTVFSDNNYALKVILERDKSR
ncbi:DUF4177 domain-containing protein [Maribacter algicola]|uniref:DUF4177 domain-containing protein n=1 Tax=Meishania litoralis TaxID=3434685 RepID=A0ACC7LP80_9FLAO